jgi:hypothetical protein
MTESLEADEADFQEQQQPVVPEAGPDLERLEGDLDKGADEADVLEQSQD